MQLHFIGTSYAPAGTAAPVVKPLAEDYGVGQLVQEQTDRIPYSQALRCLLDATALLVPGSDDATYNASKLLPYLIARKPLLAIFHRESPVCTLISKIGGATLVSFEDGDTEDELAARIHEIWFRDDAFESIVPTDDAAAEPYTDRGQARQLCRFFDAVTERETAAGKK